MKTKNDKERDELQEKLNDRQNIQVDLITMAINGCENKPEVKLGIDTETDDVIFGIAVESGDEDIVVAFRADDIEVAVDSDDEEKDGYYRIKRDVEHLFVGDLINAIWINDYEQLFGRMFKMEKEEA